MKKTATLLFLVVVLAAPLDARGLRTRTQRIAVPSEPVVLHAERVPDGANAALRVVSQLQAAAQDKRAGIGAQSILYNGTGRAVLIPAAGSVRGSNGTFFRSDITFVNYNDDDQDLLIFWMANGAAAPETFKVTIPGGRPPFTINDFVGSTMHLTGLGALFFVPVNGSNVPDLEDAAIDIFSRIWTPQPNAAGTVSQPFPGVDPDSLTGDYEAMVLGLRQDASYRTNVGIINLNAYPLSFLITVFPEVFGPGTELQEIPVVLPPLSMIQKGLAPATHYSTAVNVLVEVDEDVPGDNQSWAAYASSTDNLTGDGWVSIAGHVYDDDDLDTIGLTAARHKRGDR